MPQQFAVSFMNGLIAGLFIAYALSPSDIGHINWSTNALAELATGTEKVKIFGETITMPRILYEATKTAIFWPAMTAAFSPAMQYMTAFITAVAGWAQNGSPIWSSASANFNRNWSWDNYAQELCCYP